MLTKATIHKSLLDTSQEVITWFENQPAGRLNSGPSGKWDTSQHIIHLTKTADMVVQGLSMPKLLLRWKFGKPNRPMRDKAQIIERYQEKLSGLEPGITFTRSAGVPNTNKQEVINNFRQSIDTLVSKSEQWSEGALDKYLLPHPLMGRMLVRELLIWTAHHHLHHLEVLKKNY